MLKVKLQDGLVMVQKSGEHRLRFVVYSIIVYEVFYMPGGAGFLTSTVESVLQTNASNQSAAMESPQKQWRRLQKADAFEYASTQDICLWMNKHDPCPIRT